MDPPDVLAPPTQMRRRRSCSKVEGIYIFTIFLTILSLLKLEPVARNSVLNLNDNSNPNIDLPLQESNNDLSRITTEKKKSEKKLRPCYITVENKADYHYEVIESAIMQFPLLWDTFNCSKEDTIADVALAQQHRWAKNELEPWQNYFETHLAGTTRPRTNGDGAVIHFGSIQNYMNYSRAYDAYIGVSCDSFDWLGQLSKGPNQYCVLHGTVDKKIMQGRKKSLWEQHKERVCWVSPMHPCYFIPSDLPQFKPENFRKGDKLRLCLKASTPTTSLRYVDEGVKRLQQSGEPNIEIITMGRLMPIMSRHSPLYHIWSRKVMNPTTTNLKK